MTGNRLKLSETDDFRGRRFRRDRIHAQDGELDRNCVIRTVKKLGLESGQRVIEGEEAD